MKIKVKPEDFVVQELIRLPQAKGGDYTILKLEKRFWNTLDVIDFAARKIGVPKSLFSRAGLKDRYSLSTQYLSFKGHFKTSLHEKNFTLTPTCKANRPILPDLLIGNSFTITIRSLDTGELEKISQNHHEISTWGIPNYFDDQRFGSARHRRGFFAKALLLEHYKGALKLLLCYPYKEDKKEEKIFKNFCRENWGKWHECLDLAPRTHRRILSYLITNPKDYKNAIRIIDKELLNIYLLAYQSYLFNQSINMLIEKYGIDIVKAPYSMGQFLFPRRLNDLITMRKISIPMINEKIKLEDLGGDITGSIIEQEGLSIRDFALRKIRFRGVRFKSFLRPAIILPKNLFLGKSQDDELYPSKKKLQIGFILPAGSYATILIKRLLL